MKALRAQGYGKAKIKIGAAPLGQDLKRIETAQKTFDGAGCLAVDAMNTYDADRSLEAAKALSPLRLMWWEDVCDPLDFETQSAVTAVYPNPIAAGEALFSVAEAKLLDRHGGLRRNGDICCSIRCTAMACPATCGSSAHSKIAAGPAARSGRMVATSSRCMSRAPSASAAPKSIR
jgi:hypothetical protein